MSGVKGRQVPLAPSRLEELFDVVIGKDTFDPVFSELGIAQSAFFFNREIRESFHEDLGKDPLAVSSYASLSVMNPDPGHATAG